MKNKSKSEQCTILRLAVFSVKRFILIFITLAFAMSCCFMLFLSGLELSGEFLREKAPITFINMLLVTLLLTVMDMVRRKLTVERSVNRILFATQKISEGDFSVRIRTHRHEKPRDEFDIISRNINIMAQELSGTETLKTNFIADVSHELKTPLAVIGNYAELIKNPCISEKEREEYSQVLIEASRELSELITNILKLNKLENQQIILDKKRFNLSEQLCEGLFMFENAIEEKKLQVEADIEENVYIESDPDMLSLVWNNLLSNAIKFNRHEGSLFLQLKEEAGFVLIRVADTGCGFDSETKKHIFDKFYQGDKSHSSQGNGLGLALVKRIGDILGYEILVESEAGVGSAFTIKMRKN